MNPVEQKKAAKSFVAYWKQMPCVEEEHSRSFWIELVGDVLGIANPTHVLKFERKVSGRKIDVFYEDMGILIEMKSRGVSLDKASERSKKAGGETPYQQAKWYADNLVNSIRPRWLIVCNFDEFRIHDLELVNPGSNYVSFTLDELPAQLHLLSIFTDKDDPRIEREKELSTSAAELVGKLYSALSRQYKNIDTDPHEQRSLNILIVRLVFLLYAEDADLLHEKDALLNYLRKFSSDQMRQAIIDLFAVLDTPKDKRDPYLSESLLAFPYVNGGLFGNDDIVIPRFTEEIRLVLLRNASSGFNWAEINPTIFGAAFESTLNPETRRAGGMHYTSIESIHKVIDPLFLDDLKAKLAEIEGGDVKKKRISELREFQKELAGITVFDPACGSGNFLTESYLSLRRLENRVLENIQGDNKSLAFEGDEYPIKVSIDQFYGIEINDFAVSVAKTALYIAENQMMAETQEITDQHLDALPLKSNRNIHEGNALRMDWNDVLPAEKCMYICGNPPFIGYSNHNAAQKEDRASIFGNAGGTLDYVSCWYRKAADFTNGHGTRCAFVSTNSICQGQQVEPLWKPLFESGIHIDFAHRTFVWNSEAADQAHVHVVIVGFSRENTTPKLLFNADGTRREVEHINAYLAPAADAFITKRSKPLCDVPEMAQGFKPADGGHLLLSAEEYDEIIAREPHAAELIRPFSMGADFINGVRRYCLWLPAVTASDLKACPTVRARIDSCREWRSTQKPTGDAYKLKDTPHLLRPCGKFVDGTYIGVPTVTSGRRKYVPMGFVSNGMIPGNKLYFVPTDSLYVFGILSSQFQNAWMRRVAGRLKSDYNYGNTTVYNNFVWPEPTDAQRAEIERCAQSVLATRATHPDATLADMYDPNNDFLFPDLMAAHQALDAAVEAAYGVDFKGDEEKIVAHLFKLYTQKVSKQ